MVRRAKANNPNRPAEHLPPGGNLLWTIWKTINRLRAVAKTKVNSEMAKPIGRTPNRVRPSTIRLHN